ncbi:MAG TPA: bifunctional 2-C-methyl-D-erythritol 4-phosphate cytidylyltransferase/2-C-methyl-D-erythritol 2,4-cyclodiphosphate synthase [Epsilonproteobacteria bacterium]|nr:bifunctional 2-C-methyl-D-erythritol 4-phosphate cytidylyltransferase/2-C-methyl-D-erythritol 2,4-cyclodiphosphate synthase [Campylobacterota bacterium]
MSDITLILLSAGSATRFKTEPKKQWLYSADKPLWLQVSDHFSSLYHFNKVILVSSSTELNLMKNFADYHYVEGGNSRQASLANALQEVDTPFVLVSDIARCCLDETMIQRVLDAKGEADCIVPALPVVDTLYLENKPADRSSAMRIQTPQLSRSERLKQALLSGFEYTDESSAIVAGGGTLLFVDGSENAHKLTTIDDLSKLPCLKKPSPQTLTGFGIDIHPFEEGKTMMLCGIEIDAPYGFKAHSDGDVAIHALIDALLGAAGFGDIGEFYPDTDEQYAEADSRLLLGDTVQTLRSCGLCIGNVDLTNIARVPSVLPDKEQMRRSLADLLGIRANFVNIKATTAEKLGFLGRKEGVAVEAVANLTYFDWTQL